MTSAKLYTIFLKRKYNTHPDAVFNLFTNGTVFRLTGADLIQSDYSENGLFCLTFNQRGKIHGRFLSIESGKITIEWNVIGFNKPDENNTIVEIVLQIESNGCLLTLNHTNIKNEEGAGAKQRAWNEILRNLENEIEDNGTDVKLKN
jgi:hypothetical protein